MRLLALASLFTIVAVLAMALEPEKHPAGILPPGRNHDWLKFIAARDKTMTRVTERPLKMGNTAVMFCASIPDSETRVFNPHRDYYIHVYVTKGEEQKIRTGEGKYPVGTLIVKAKLTAIEPPLTLDFSRKITDEKDEKILNPPPSNDHLRDPELFTAMLKREAGYNKECGDWEFMVVSGDAKSIVARGKIDSCIDCHKGRNRNDYVTRLYPAK